MKKQILVVDDNRQMLEFIANLLEDEGHQVTTAENGFSALNLLISFTPDIIFADLVMPVIGGDKLFKIARKMEHLKDCCPVLVSAAASELDFDYTEIGADSCIAKGPSESIAGHVLAAVKEADSLRRDDRHKAIRGINEVYPRQMTRELLSRNRHLETMLESMAEGIIEIFSGKVVYANSAAASLFGMPPEKLLFKHLPGLFDEAQRPYIESLLKTENGLPADIDPDTSVPLNGKQVIIKKQAVKGDETTHIIIITDVTERKRTEVELKEYRDHLEVLVKKRTVELTQTNMLLQKEIDGRIRVEEELLESKERFDSFMKHLPGLAFMKDLDGRYVYLNEAYNDMLAGNPVDFIGRTDDEIWSAEVAGPMKANDTVVMSEGRVLSTVATVTIGDETQYFRITKFPVFKGNRPFLLAGIALNITERYLSEMERKKLEIRLQQAQKMEAIGTLAGGVAHDLNNVLSGLVSYPDLLLRDLPEDSPLRKAISTIKQSGEKAASIVQDLLTLARRGVAVTKVVALNDIISEYLISPEHDKLRLYHPQVELAVELETGLLNIIGSPVHLSMTVLNLVSNATESMPDGGKITISTENRYIDRPLRGYEDVEEGDYVTLVVSDTGSGISAGDMERIFDPFYTKKVMGKSGTGLGMAVVWGTVRDHKGYIDVQSTPGKGTTFTLYFPATREELIGDDALLSIEDLSGKGESILIVDDVHEQREIACQMLTRLGYRAASVSSGEAAVDHVKDNVVDLLVLDMIMDPGIDGLETYKRIIALHPGQKAVITSGFSETGQVKEAQRLGAGAYIKKPYTLEKLGKAVRAELNHTV
ncbi:MAG: response regulator [Desulfobacterales bacterium]|uniref:histidine kinase n=1 Tax=Candidatus Desulfatibia profunda TaxID=2841695 RepID=A0A8J6TNM8_9BACT|nr:response regulator [Candidatus Desulfatibia profunda]MBL7181176.1 response regulator [Desulfobacterales bacterium]